jgi:hypothetical protein
VGGNHYHATPNWLLVALTRSADASVARYDGKEVASQEYEAKRYFETLVRGNVRSDTQRTGVATTGGVTAKEAARLYYKCGTRCCECLQMMSVRKDGQCRASVDRVGARHTAGQVRIVCVSCNHAGGAAQRASAQGGSEDE